MTDTETSTVAIHYPLARGRTEVIWRTFTSLDAALTFIRLLLWGGIQHIVLMGPERYLSDLERAAVARLPLVRLD
jgi:hypothetical protein